MRVTFSVASTVRSAISRRMSSSARSRRGLDVALGALAGFGEDRLRLLFGLVLVRVRRLAGALHDLFGLRARFLQTLAVFGEDLVGLLARALGRVDRLFDRSSGGVSSASQMRGKASLESSTIVIPKTSSVQIIRPMPGLIRKLPFDAASTSAVGCARTAGIAQTMNAASSPATSP